MALSSIYGKITIPNIGDTEPVFILRAQDKLSRPVLKMYRSLVQSHGTRISPEAQHELDAFDQWKRQQDKVQ